MKELKTILSTYSQTPKEEKLALATVVRVEGSSYRRMGARMLVSETGNWVGGISGGCLEGDALKRARMAILKDKASIITYDTSIDDENQIGVGLGCDGIIDVLFKPIDSLNPLNVMAILQKCIEPPRKIKKLLTISKCSDATLLGELISYENISNLNSLQPFCDSHKLSLILDSLDKSKNVVLNSSLSIFAEVMPPPIQLVLFGHQYDLYPLIRLAKEVGFDISVVAAPNKVKKIDGISLYFPRTIDSLVFDNYTAVILMSHSLQTDKDHLKFLSNRSIQYIGMLGPKVRSERILKELRAEGCVFSKDFDSQIYAPTGLDIGATNPEEISLSILAEIKKVFSHRSGLALRERKMPIHSREQTMTFD